MNVPLVVDASAAANFLLPDESNAYGDAVLRRIQTAGAVVPSLWAYEVGNLLTFAVRKKRIDEAYREEALKRLLVLRIEFWGSDGVSPLIHGERIADLAGHFRLSFYDAAYLFVAQERRLALATLDRPLERAARDLGLTVFVSG